MNHEYELSRRSLLGQAAGAAALAATVQAQPAAENSAPRIRESFDFGWKFFKGDAPGAQQPDFADAPLEKRGPPSRLEHRRAVQRERAGPGGACRPASAGTASASALPESYRGRMVIIEFDGIYENSEVWINGQYLGKRPYGYIPFSYDLTPHLNFGRDNVIAVKVDNSHQTNCRWYSGSGIYRHTWLLVTNPVHVAYWGTFVTTPHVSKDAATVQIKTRVRNDGKSAARVHAGHQHTRPGRAKRCRPRRRSQEVAADGEYEFVQQVTVAKPNLWSVANPYLYTSPQHSARTRPAWWTSTIRPSASAKRSSTPTRDSC